MRAVSSPWGTYGGRDEASNVVPIPLSITPARLPDAHTIPPRPWLYGTMLVRGFVSLLVSPGGVGKTQLAMAVAASLASGRSLLGHHIYHRTNTWLLNLEDPLDEMDRRLAALIIHHGIADRDLTGRLFMDGASDRGLCIARVGEESTIMFPDRDQVIALARAAEIGCIIVDPFIRSHSLEENSNPHMDEAVRAWASIAREVNAAILIVHHVRKGPVVDIDSARGGSALKDAARATMLLSPMSAEEAEQFNIEADQKWRHIRLDDGKVNMAPPAQADWFVMNPVRLGNGTTDYPNGDTVPALAKWIPETPWDRVSSADCNRALDEIAQGPREGSLYAPTKRGASNGRWVGSVVMRVLGTTESSAKQIVAAWLKNGLLIEEEYHDKGDRKARVGVRVIDERRPD